MGLLLDLGALRLSLCRLTALLLLLPAVLVAGLGQRALLRLRLLLIDSWSLSFLGWLAGMIERINPSFVVSSLGKPADSGRVQHKPAMAVLTASRL